MATKVAASWQDQAVAAFRAKKQEAEEAEIKRNLEDLAEEVETLRTAFRTILGVDIEPTGGEIEIDGIRWVAGWNSYRQRYWLRRRDICLTCGHHLMTDDLTSQIEVGQAIDTPYYNHSCSSPPESRATEPGDAKVNFVRALRALLAEVPEDWDNGR